MKNGMLNGLIFLIFLIGFAGALTPPEFDERLGNLIALNYASYEKRPPETLGLEKLLEEAYASAYALKGSERDVQVQLLNERFGELQKYLAIDLKPLAELALIELKAVASAAPSIEMPRSDAKTAAESQIIVSTAPTPQKRRIPTITPEQLRGKKNVLYALADVLWENALLLGAMLVGMLIIYFLYSREEDEASLEVSE